MTRTVVFDGDRAAKRFELVRTAILNAGDGKAERSRERIRKEARVLDMLDEISEPAIPPKMEGDRQLRIGQHTLTLKQDDHKMVEEYLNLTPWLPRTAQAATDTQDWWETAEKIE